MSPSARKEHKAGNRQRREVAMILAGLPQPGSKSDNRRRFERAHDEWRRALGWKVYVR